MLENFIMQVRRPKGVSCEREAFVAAALARAAARQYKIPRRSSGHLTIRIWKYFWLPSTTLHHRYLPLLHTTKPPYFLQMINWSILISILALAEPNRGKQGVTPIWLLHNLEIGNFHILARC